jgi:hypothetical protein
MRKVLRGNLRMAKRAKWVPKPGELAHYWCTSGKLARGGLNVRVLAEASGGYMVVEALRNDGTTVRISVKATSLRAPQPSLF